MSQFDFGTIDPYVVDGVELADMLNQWRNAIYSMQSGTTRPAFIVPGMCWVDTSTGPTTWLVKQYVSPAVGDITLYSFNTTTGVPTLGTGTLAVTNPATGDNSAQVATDAFVQAAIAGATKVGATSGQTFLTADVALNATGTVFNVLNTGSIGAAGQIFDIAINCHTLTTSGAGNPDIGIHDGTNYLAVARLSAAASSIARCSAGISVRVTLAAPTTFTFKAQDAANATSVVSANAGSPGPFSTTSKATYIKWTRLN